MPSPRHAHTTFAAPDLDLAAIERRRFQHCDLAPRTVASYEADWRVFVAWCEAAKRPWLPASADTVELYATDLISRGRRITTVERHAIAVQYHHRLAGCESPCGAGLRLLLAGARRTLCQVPLRKQPIGSAEIRRMVRKIGSDTPIHARNSALLVFGFASSLRRGNLAAMRREDLNIGAGGIVVTVRNEKQDRKGRGRIIAVAAGRNRLTDPVRAIRRWLKWRGDQAGPLFSRVLSGHADNRAILPNRITQIVQECAAAIHLDGRLYSAHSLRAGFVTEALERGVNEIAIARQTGHASLDTLRIYMRSRDPFRGNASAMVGL